MKDYFRHSKRVTRGQRWHTIRMAVLERDGFVCRSCGKGGRLEVDHVHPVKTHPELSFDPANLQALCTACHTRKTRLECGHPPASESRLKWREAVAELATKPHRARRKSHA
jgi:5-methylcytosine-specific restriction endonuclease McrA